MRTMFVATLLLGTVAAPAVSNAAAQPAHHASSGQHHSSQHQSMPGGISRHVTPGPSWHSRPAPPGGISRHVTPGASWQHSPSMPPGGISHYRHSPVVSPTPRFGTEPPLRHDRHGSSQVHWNHDWRYDHRYNWHDYRQHHYSSYHLGSYHDPYGWGYWPFSIGWRLWPDYYRSSYWLNDPWMYRLPPAPPGTHWIRYYNDALLVDTWTGEVIDVIQGFFW